MSDSLSHILQSYNQRKEVHRKEAQAGVEAAIVNFLKQHPIIIEVSWQHGEEYNDESYCYAFSNLRFCVAEPLHTQLWKREKWMDDYGDEGEPMPFPVIPSRYQQLYYKTPAELPEAYADGRLGAAIEALKTLNEEFRTLDADLMEIFGTPGESHDTIVVTIHGIQE